MTKDNWLTIALIISTCISTLASPLLNSFVQSRISQPKPRPKAKQPKKPRRKKTTNLVRIVNLAAIGFSSWKLYVAVNDTVLASGQEVFRIVMLTVAVTYNAFILWFSAYALSLEDEIDQIKSKLKHPSAHDVQH